MIMDAMGVIENMDDTDVLVAIHIDMGVSVSVQ